MSITINTNTSVVPYEQPELGVTVDDEAGPAVVSVVDGAGGPIRGRVITLGGATVSSITTNSAGNAMTEFISTIVQARFPGDGWRTGHSSYYLPTQALSVSYVSLMIDATEVVGFLIDATLT